MASIFFALDTKDKETPHFHFLSFDEVKTESP